MRWAAATSSSEPCVNVVCSSMSPRRQWCIMLVNKCVTLGFISYVPFDFRRQQGSSLLYSESCKSCATRCWVESYQFDQSNVFAFCRCQNMISKGNVWYSNLWPTDSLLGVPVVRTIFRKLMGIWHRSVSKLGWSCFGYVQSSTCSCVWCCWWGQTLALWHSQLWVAKLRWAFFWFWNIWGLIFALKLFIISSLKLCASEIIHAGLTKIILAEFLGWAEQFTQRNLHFDAFKRL